MNQSMKLRLSLLILICGCGLAAAPAHGKGRGDKHVIIAQARQAYYSLSRFGLIEFQSNIQPNWEVVLKDELAANPSAAQESLRLLNGLHFPIRLDPKGNVKVDHIADFPPPNERVAAGFKQIYGGMEQAVSGFFETWNLFMLNSPFPEVDSEYQLEDLGGQYRLSYQEGAADVVTTMTGDLAITEIKVSATEFKSSIKPHFMKTEKGYVLTAYEGNYQPVTGPGATRLNVQLDYQEVNGLQLPRKLHLDGVYEGRNPFEMELLFSKYQVKTRARSNEPVVKTLFLNFAEPMRG